MSRREYREFQDSMIHGYDPERKKRLIIIVSTVLVLAIGIGAILGVDMYRTAENERIAEAFRAEVRGLELEKVSLNNRYRDVVKNLLGCSAVCTLLLDEPHAVAYDVIYTEIMNLVAEESITDQTGMIAISPNELPGDEGNMTKDQFDEMLANGWTVTLRYRGAAKDGSLDEYIKAAHKTLTEKGYEIPSSLYFDLNTYSIMYDDVLEEHGIKYAIHHGESKADRVEKLAGGELLHPGATGWNTNGLKNTLAGVAYSGGYTIVSMGFDILVDPYAYFESNNSEAIASFKRMITSFYSYVNEDKMLFTNSPEDAFQFRALYLKEYELALPTITAERARIQVLIDEVDLQILEIHKKYYDN